MKRLIAVLLVASLLLSACQHAAEVTQPPAATPTLPAAATVLPSSEYGISNNTILGMKNGFYLDAIQRFLESRVSPLATYEEKVDQQTYTAAEIIWMVSQSDEYNLDPKALLINLYVETSLTWPEGQGGFYDHMQAMALRLVAAQKSYNDGQRVITLANGDVLAVEGNSALGIFMVASYFSLSTLSIESMKQLLGEWRDAYEDMFAEKAQKSLFAGISAVPAPLEPFMRLPFDQPENQFFYINSFFDHDSPRNFNNTLVTRFDGRRLDIGSFSSCALAFNCYSGHNALDYSTPMYTPLYAVADGKVIYRNDPNGGLMIQHPNGYITIYWHMERIDVTINQVVTEGQQLGVSGNRGQSTGPHLHFGLRRASDSVDIDPYGWYGDYDDPWIGMWAWKGDLIADNREAQAQLFYNRYWYRDTNGYEGESWYTMTVTTPGSSTNWAIWGTYIYQPGTYTVSAYWPKTEYNTVEADYQVWSNRTVYTSTVSQANDGDRFVPLGTFYLDRGPSVVILKDLTHIKSQRIYFDAVMWTPAPSASKYPFQYTFPLVFFGDQPWH